MRSDGAVVLVYHRVDEGYSDPFDIQVSPSNFRSQIEYLRVNYTMTSLDNLLDIVSAGSDTSGMAAITFDDGYQSVLTVAKPILEECYVPATVFLTADFLEGREFWWERLVANLEAKSGVPVTAENAAQHRELIEAWEKLRSLSLGNIDRALQGLEANVDPDTVLLPKCLTAEEAKELVSGVISVGAHTLTHPSLAALPEDIVEEEIRGSRYQLEKFFRSPVTTFSYPFGEFDEQARSKVALAGFRCAFALGQTSFGKRPDLFALPQINPGNRNAAEFEALLGQTGPARAATHSSISTARVASASAVVPVLPEFRTFIR